MYIAQKEIRNPTDLLAQQNRSRGDLDQILYEWIKLNANLPLHSNLLTLILIFKFNLELMNSNTKIISSCSSIITLALIKIKNRHWFFFLRIFQKTIAMAMVMALSIENEHSNWSGSKCEMLTATNRSGRWKHETLKRFGKGMGVNRVGGGGRGGGSLSVRRRTRNTSSLLDRPLGAVLYSYEARPPDTWFFWYWNINFIIIKLVSTY